MCNKRNLIKIVLKTTPKKKAGVHATYPQVFDNHSIHRIEMAQEKSRYILLTNCPSCILSLEPGLELMRESGKPVYFGSLDFYKVFSRTFVEGRNKAVGT